MTAFGFGFPSGRYHATPWGRHPNEADVAWPPEPIRILRALIATWWRKGNHERFPKVTLDALIDALAAELPIFHLPEAVHTHVRAFMPAPQDRKLIYDAFFRLDRDAQIIVAWPSVVLTPDQLSLAAHLLERIGYLGRAESWTEGFVALQWDGQFNSAPRTADASTVRDLVPVDVAVPVTPRNWSELQERFMRELKGKAMSKRDRVLTEATVPARLADALSVDTAQWQKAGWSSPPPLRKVIYDRPTVGPLPPRIRRKSSLRAAQPGIPEVARFVLAGRPRPRVEDTLRIGEVARLAVMSKFRGERPPIELTGRGDDGPLRDDPSHAHAFYLPEDTDRDGLIDHLVVYCRLGFSDAARKALDGLTALWLEYGRADEEGERGRKEWRVALEDIANPAAFAGSSRLLKRTRVWESVTPYLKNRFDKQRPKSFSALVETYSEQITTEWKRRFADMPAPNVEPMVDHRNPARFIAPVGPGRALRSTLAFARTRGGRGGRQVDSAGGFFRLAFDSEVEGPVALGWGAHFGLGLFAGLDAPD